VHDLQMAVGGEADSGEAACSRYQELAQLLRSRGMDIAKLANDGKKAWRLTLVDGVSIAIGRDQVMEKMQRFIRIYDLYLQDAWDEVKAIDVRYGNGVAVRWRPEEAARLSN
jgi:cell division protein FtsQ